MKKQQEYENNCRAMIEKYDALLNNIQEIIFQFDSNGIILFVNLSWERITGYPMSETIGKNILRFLLTEELKGISSQVESKELCGEFYFLTKDKKIKMLEISMKPSYLSSGKMNGYSGSLQDVTERKEQELLIKAGKQYVENLNKNLQKRIQEEVAKNRKKDRLLIEQSRLTAMTEMIANIGQQWRQPLNNLSLMIQDIHQALEYGEMNELYIDQFSRESMILIQYMQQTIHDFRKFYRPTKEKNFFSLADSIEDALSIFSLNLKKHDIHVQFEYRGQQTVYGSPNEFSQVILNVLTNSRDAFIFHDVKNRNIRIRIFENNSTYVVEINDNARGILPALMPKVFEPYMSTNRHGSGLGLYMAKVILEEMNGAVKVDNTGDGACFSLIVPKISVGLLQVPSFA